MKIRLIAVTSVLALMIIGYFIFFADNSSEKLEYTLAEAGLADIESVVSTTGTLAALNTVLVGSQLSGQVAELSADFNSPVAENQVIARIDPRTFETRVQQSEAELEIANANIAQQAAELVKAKSAKREASLDMERLKKLKIEGHVAESELDRANAALESAVAQVSVVEAQQTNAQAVRSQRLATLRQAELDLERSYIRSPINGTVIERNIELGQTVAASLQAPTLFTIAQDLRWMKVEASVDEADIGRLTEGMQCRFGVDAYPERVYQGQIKQIRKAPDIVQNVVTYKVIIEANNQDLSLFPGMTANVEMILGSKRQVLAVPNAALRFKPKSAETGSPPAGMLNSLMSGGRFPGSRHDNQGSSAAQTNPLRSSAGTEPWDTNWQGREDPSRLLAKIRGVTDLTDDQQRQLTELFSAQSDRAKQLLQAGKSSEEIHAEMQSAREATMRQVATIIGEEAYANLKTGVRQTRAPTSIRATIWMLGKNNLPIAKEISIGLNDDQTTEVTDGLEKGQEVIVRATRKMQ